MAPPRPPTTVWSSPRSSKDWRPWKRNGWRKSDKKPALNADLWDKLLTLLEFHQVGFRWVHGHQGHPENERCDQMAVMESQKYAR